MCLCVRDHISATTRPIFTKRFARVTHGRGSVLLWRRSDTLCTSGFMHDVIFARKPRLLDVASQLNCSAHAALGLAVLCAVIPVAGQQMHGTTFRMLKVFSQVSTPGAESAVYDCLVIGGRVWAWIPQREGALLGVILGPHLPAVSILHLIRLRAPPMHPATTSLLWQLDH